jgi:hypothetical protein
MIQIPYFINIIIYDNKNKYPFTYTKTGIVINSIELTNIFNDELTNLMMETTRKHLIILRSYKHFIQTYYPISIFEQTPVSMQYFEDNIWKVFNFIDNEVMSLYVQKYKNEIMENKKKN